MFECSELAASVQSTLPRRLRGKVAQFFIPIFFVVTGFLIDPTKFVYGILDDFFLVASIVGALLVGKWIAAWAVGHTFGYSPDERLTVWSLTLPQVAATLAATLVAHDTIKSAGQRLLERSSAR